MKPVRRPFLLSLIPLLFLLLCFLGGYAFLDHLFPKASELQLPAADDITSLALSTDTGAALPLPPEDHAALLQALCASRPTRRMSVNDVPDVRPYYRLELSTPDRQYYIYLYEESAQLCVELPYEGVYRADPQLSALLLP